MPAAKTIVLPGTIVPISASDSSSAATNTAASASSGCAANQSISD
jgi:hypothetical protein